MTDPGKDAPMTVRNILEQWLREHGYDGLYTTDCGCKIGDLVPCGEDCTECMPGVLTSPDPDEDVEWYVGPKEGDS
jgi:hypothetical protein